MYNPQKKMLVMNILEILKNHSDENHRLSQKDISDLLQSEYNLTVDRKSVRRNLTTLIELGYNIEYTETVRMVVNKDGTIDENLLLSDFYYVREFTDGELRLLIDSLLFSKHIPFNQCEALVRKLEGLSSKYFQHQVRHVNIMPTLNAGNNQLFLTIETLDSAIYNGNQVSFYYNDFDTDKKLHPRKDRAGEPQLYTVNPFQISAANGRYYLICNHEDRHDFDVYRLDRITEIQMLNTPAKPFYKVNKVMSGTGMAVEVSDNMQIFVNGKVHVTFRLNHCIINDMIDCFGTDIIFIDDEKEGLLAKVTADPLFVRKWALSNAHNARIIAPKSLAEDIRRLLQTGLENYDQ